MWEGVAIDKLTLFSAKVLREPGRYGDGLYLIIAPSASKSWVRRIVFDGRHRDMGFGSCPIVRLDQARTGGIQPHRCLRRAGPLVRKAGRQRSRSQPCPLHPHLRPGRRRVIKIRWPALSNPKHAAQWENTLATCVFPSIGETAVAAIAAADVLAVLCPSGRQAGNGQLGQAASGNSHGLGGYPLTPSR